MVDLEKKRAQIKVTVAELCFTETRKMSPCLRKGRRKISIPVGKPEVWLGGYVSSTTLTYTGAMLCLQFRES